MKKILIPGGAGFIGFHLSRVLADAGHDIVIADNFFRGKRDADFEALLARPNVHLVEGDLTDRRAWDALGGGYDEVYHLVGINGTHLFYEIPHEVLRIGIATTMNALEWFRSTNGKPGAKILYTSSNEAYASGFDSGIIPIPTPETVPLIVADTYNPRWSYGAQKLIGELFFIHYAKAYGLRTAIVRPHNFYGPRAGYEHVIPQLAGRIEERADPFTLFGADDTRSFCYIDDSIEAIVRVMESQKTDGETYHIGTSVETRISELAEQMFALSGWHPSKLDRRTSPEGSVKRRLPDVSKIERDTGWTASVGLEEGLARTIEWYKAHPRPAQ